MITTIEFGRIRRDVMKNMAPDFIKNKNKNIYVRENENGQIHCIGYSMFGREKEFTIQLGAHYKFIPSFKIYGSNHKAIHPAPDTCAITGGCLIDGKRTSSYGETLESSKAKLESGITDSLNVLNSFNDKWGNGEAMLDVLTPKIMQQDAQDFLKVLNASDGHEMARISATLTSRRELPNLDPLVGPLSLLLAFLASKYKSSNEVNEYLKIMEMNGITRFFDNRHKEEFLPHLLPWLDD